MADKLLAEWFWLDRWMGSSAFGLSIDARGLYREMLSQSWRRGACLPNDHDHIRRITGVTVREWKKAWPKIAKYWTIRGDCLVNSTQIEVYTEALRRTEMNGARAKAAAEARWKQEPSTNPSNAQASTQALHEECPPSPSPSVRRSLEQAEVVPTDGDDTKSTESTSQDIDVLLSYPTTGKVKALALTSAQVEAWQALYPNLDIVGEARKALAWVHANQRKTARGMPAFLVAWLNRATDRPKQAFAQGRAPSRGAEQMPTGANWRAPWRDECAAAGHDPACPTPERHALRLVVAETCPHWGVCETLAQCRAQAGA